MKKSESERTYNFQERFSNALVKNVGRLQRQEQTPYEQQEEVSDSFSDLSGYSARGEYNLDKDKRGYIYFLNENHQVTQKIYQDIEDAKSAFEGDFKQYSAKILFYLGQVKYQIGNKESVGRCIQKAKENQANYQLLKEPIKELADFKSMEYQEHVGDQQNDRIDTIDFQKEKQMYKERTEMELPYTLTTVEDTMYINQQHVITLEYHLFQDKCKYVQLKETVVGQEDMFGLKNYGKHVLDSQQFHAYEKDFVNFREEDSDECINFEENDMFQRVHESQMVDTQDTENIVGAMTARIQSLYRNKAHDKKDVHYQYQDEKHNFCLGVIAEYSVTQNGTMRRVNETTINMGRNFIPSGNGNMTLTRSYGKQIVSLVNFDQNNRKGKYFKVKAWTTSLDPHEVKEELNQGLNKYYEEHKDSWNQLVSLTFAGRKTLVELVYVERTPRSKKEQAAYQENILLKQQQKKQMTLDQQKDIGNIEFRTATKYVFFDTQTGAVKFSYGGVSKYDDSDMIPKILKEDGSSLIAYEIGMLVKETREDYVSETDHQEYFHFYVIGDFFHERCCNDHKMLWTECTEQQGANKECYKCLKPIIQESDLKKEPPKWIVVFHKDSKFKKFGFKDKKDAQAKYDQLFEHENKILYDAENESEINGGGKWITHCIEEAKFMLQLLKKGFYQCMEPGCEKYKHTKCKETLKNDQPLMQWCLIDLEISQSEILKISDPEEQRKFFVQQLCDALPTNDNQDEKQHFFIDQNIVQQSAFNWEVNISVAANRTFDTFSIIDNPFIINPKSLCSIYVNGSSFSDHCKKRLNDPFYLSINHDVYVEHGRNAYVKNEMFIIENQKTTGDRKTYYIQPLHGYRENCVALKNIEIHHTQILSKHDVWMQTKRDFKTDTLTPIFQTVCVNQGDQYCLLQTRIPMNSIGGIPMDYQIVKRNTNIFEQQTVNCPFVAYNIGDCKILIQNVQQKGSHHKTFILDLCHEGKLHGDHDNPLTTHHQRGQIRFQCFVTFQNFHDIGFNPTGLDIELCSHIAFVTHDLSQPINTQNRMNLLLMDPFSERKNKLNCVWFKSSSYFDNEFIKENDSVIKAVAQCSKKRVDDDDYKLYIWMQMPHKLIRSKMLDPNSLKFIEDSDNTDDEDKFVHPDQDFQKLTTKTHQETVKFLQDPQGFIYYVNHKNGEIQVMEGNPKNPYIKHHQCIYNLKVEGIIAFNGNGDEFQIMDHSYIIHNLSRKRNKGERMLQLVDETKLKEIQKLDYLPQDFDEQYIGRNYAIIKSKIYYFHEANRKEYPDGIMDAEELIEKQMEKDENDLIQKNYWMRGPFKFEGSNRFYNVYRKNKFTTFMKIFYLPDSTEKTLCNDFQNGVDMSTFLQNGKILIKNFHQYMIFNQKGVFIDKVTVEPYDNLVMASHSGSLITLAKFYHLSVDLQKEWDAMEKSHNHIQQTFEDFEGAPYNPKSDSQKKREEDNSEDRHQNPFKKLHLINFSYNNKYYLFLEKTTGQQRLLMFELKIYHKDSAKKAKEPKKNEPWRTPNPMVDEVPEPVDDTKEFYSFVLLYELNVGESKLWLESIYERQNLVSYFTNNNDQVKIDKFGNVSMCYVTTLKVDEHAHPNKKKKTKVMKCKVRGAIFQRKNSSSISICKNFEQEFTFPYDTIQKLDNIIQSRKKEIYYKIKQMLITQQRLPKEFHDYNEYDNMIHDYRSLEETSSRFIYCKFYFDDLIVLYCGNYVKYGRLYKNPVAGDKNDTHHLHFLFQKQEKGLPLIDLNVIFDEQVQVQKLIETNVTDWVQIVNKNYVKNIVTVLTWDFATNTEKSCYQAKPNRNDQIAYNVVKGLNYKLNYLQNQDFIIDLENSIPIKQKNVKQDINTSTISYRKQLSQINNYYNQRKINKDNQNTLGIEKAHCMYYNISRIDLKLWEDLSRFHFKLDFIKQSIQLKDCQSMFGGMSIFHLFAGDPQIIEIMSKLFERASVQKNLTGNLKALPLLILNPDFSNNTALQCALINQSPSAFEIMIDMLQGSPDLTMTKMMLDSMMLILDHSSPKVMKFLEKALFIPQQMQIEQFIPWPKDSTKEIIFPCHTCIVSYPLLLKAIGNEMEWTWPLNKLSALGFENPFLTLSKNAAVQDDYEVPVLISNNKDVNNGDLMFHDLHKEDKKHSNLESIGKKRVQCQALDMDWLFDHNNAEVLIEMISSIQGKEALTKAPIQHFVQMMWSRFQPRIVSYVFVPYLIYMALIIVLSGFTVNDYMMSREAILFSEKLVHFKNTKDPNYTLEDDSEYKLLVKYHQEIRSGTLSSSVVLLLFIVYFSTIELRQYRAAGLSYFFDGWNMIDLTSLCLNFSFGSMFFVCVLYDEIFFQREQILSIASWAVFFMWIKVFYWFRLFTSYAYFVRLIIQTLNDASPFMILTLIVMISFANFIFVAEQTLPINDDNPYAGVYFGYKPLDAIVTIYDMGALLDFNASPNYTQGNEMQKFSMLAIWIGATWIVFVVFLNMLIAIMSNTFSDVYKNAIPNGLQEQVILMSDHTWLVNTKALFSDARYIMRVAPSNKKPTQVEVYEEAAVEMGEAVGATITQNSQRMGQRLDFVENNTGFLLDKQYQGLDHTITQLHFLQKGALELHDIVHDKCDIRQKLKLSRERTLNYKAPKMKAGALSLILKKLFGNSISVDQNALRRITMEWIEVLDRDQSGYISLPEFYLFFVNFQGSPLNDAQIQDLFQSFDTSKDGEISVQEFSVALRAACEQYNDQPEPVAAAKK